jgi:hypothetical protein
MRPSQKLWRPIDGSRTHEPSAYLRVARPDGSLHRSRADRRPHLGHPFGVSQPAIKRSTFAAVRSSRTYRSRTLRPNSTPIRLIGRLFSTWVLSRAQRQARRGPIGISVQRASSSSECIPHLASIRFASTDQAGFLGGLADNRVRGHRCEGSPCSPVSWRRPALS